VVKRGELHLCDFGDPIGHEPGFRRPAVVVSHDELNRHGIAVVLPVTRTRRGYPTHVELEAVLPVTSYVQCELVRAVSTERLLHKVGELNVVQRAAIEAVLRRLLSL
jgi:mRNA interferase MazF